MPYKVEKSSKCPSNKPWACIKSTDGKVMGCHPTKDKAVEQMKALYAKEGSMREGLILGTASQVETAKLSGGGYQFKGVATGTSIVDRMKRVFLPGAFDPLPAQVPLLAFHQDNKPVGISQLSKKGSLVLHESKLLNIDYAQELEELIKGGAIPATSIGWTSTEMYWGFSELEERAPKLVQVLEKNNIPKEESIIYFNQADIMENSLTPVPANPVALISVASMMGGRERGMIEAMLDLAKMTPAVESQGEEQAEIPYLAAVELAERVRSMFIMPTRRETSEEELESNTHRMLDLTTDILRAAVWDTSYVNKLPDSAFAYIAPGGKKDADGKTTPRSLRYFPHHTDSGSPDAPHVKNALARIPQAKIPDAAKASATAHVKAHAKKLGIETSAVEMEHAQDQTEDPDENVNLLVSAIDQALDDAIEHYTSEEMNEAWPLIIAADQTVDELMELLGIDDPDEAGEASIAKTLKGESVKHVHAKEGGGKTTHSHPQAEKGHKHPGLLPYVEGSAVSTEGEVETQTSDFGTLDSEIAALASEFN